ncbi:MAG: hypothetical protein ACTSSH_04445 [Candidatus Heimdallarchaeota archaeon]
MVLTWINYLCAAVGSTNFIMLLIITSIVLKRNSTERINWLFSISFFFIAVAYVVLPLGAFVYSQANPIPMVILTKIYIFSLSTGLVLLMLSSLAINYGTHFTFRWPILIPSIIVVLTIGVTLFAFPTIEAVGGESADIKTASFFMAMYYPICLTIIAIIFVFFGRAYKNTADENIRLCLRFFLTGFALCVFSLIPNILSNVLADQWDNAQILNAIEFIIISMGIILLLVGFFVRSRKPEEQAAKAIA